MELTLSLTHAWNLRCAYCMPEEGLDFLAAEAAHLLPARPVEIGRGLLDQAHPLLKHLVELLRRGEARHEVDKHVAAAERQAWIRFVHCKNPTCSDAW